MMRFHFWRSLVGGQWFRYFCLTAALIHMPTTTATEPVVVVLGTAQDGGYPQAGCRKACCAEAWSNIDLRRYVSCLAIVDPDSRESWLLDCTPDFRDQLQLLNRTAAWDPRAVGASENDLKLSGILPTHAHVGHYAGLIHLGREVMGAKQVPLFAMPRMKFFLESNGPWDQLVALDQIEIKRLVAGEPSMLNARLSVTPFLVPHRDEYSETVGFQVDGPERSCLYLPDIDKWERWDLGIESLIAGVDQAYLDGTFYSAEELPGRDMSEIPHPFISESLLRFAALSPAERRKIHFIHLNHSNPALREKSPEASEIRRAGMSIAVQGSSFRL
jgi:pyrroloquinoline quinone biosynthesis protein B